MSERTPVYDPRQPKPKQHTNPVHDKRPMRGAYVPRAVNADTLDAALKDVKWRKAELIAVESALSGVGLYLTAEYVREIDRYADAMSEPPSAAVARVIRHLQAEGIAR